MIIKSKMDFRGDVVIFILSESFLLISSLHADCLTITGDILTTHQTHYSTGQVVAQREWFKSLERTCSRHESFLRLYQLVPWLIFGKSAHWNVNLPIKNQTIASIRYTSSRFAHLQHFDSNWTLTEKHSIISRFKYGSRSSTHIKTLRLARKKVIFQFDLHLTMLTKSSISDNNIDFSIFKIQHIYSHIIWLNCDYEKSSDNSHRSLAGKLETITELCIFSTLKDYKFLQLVDSCRNNAISVEYVGELYSYPDQLESFAHVGRNHSEIKQNDPSNAPLHRSKWYRKGYLYDSLVFITKKDPENETNSWGPFSLVSWIGILAAYTITAIVFGVIKIATMNNLDNSWYECVISHVMGLIKEEKTFRCKENNATTVANESLSCMVTGADRQAFSQIGSKTLEMDNEYNGKISVNYLQSWKSDGGNEYSFLVQERNFYQHNRGEMSKAILCGTIRVVSFILLATYEGKLYNRITFPNSNVLTSFDELVSGDNYLVKFSNGVANNENVSTTVHGEQHSESVTSLMSESQSFTVTESVNILDCVNWVESDPNTNHACVGYEFELRNLHKAQKSDKLLVKSKRKLVKYGSSFRFQRRRGFTLFPGGFQISKWVLESGILQLWSMIENAFMESLFNTNWSDPFKSFTIRDYLGLFVVYALMLILATIMFLLENGVALSKRIVKNKKVVKIYKFIQEHVNICKCKQSLLFKWGTERTLSAEMSSKKYFQSMSSKV